VRVSAARIKTLISSSEIDRRIQELAVEIAKAYGDEKPLLVGVLKGSVFFLSDLARALGEGYPMDFMAVSSYSADESSGSVKINMDLGSDIRGRHVLLVEDIVDTGTTLTSLINLLQTREPASIRVVTLLFKPQSYRGEHGIEFVGFPVPANFVVGYGMDLNEEFRNLPYVGIVERL
jgi:hypoxanthine phosphoribosyltransferase